MFKLFYLSLIFCVCVASRRISASCPKKCFCLSSSVSCVWVHLRNIPEYTLGNITTLDLRYNKIERLNENSWTDWIDLETLLLNNNNIKSLQKGSFNHLNNLHTLNLQQNGIKNIEAGVFEDLHKLKQLFLSHNNLATLETNVFQGLSKLIKLHLHNNNIKFVTTDAFPEIISIENLRLDGNPLVCDCELIWLVDSLLENEQVRLNSQVDGFCNEPSTVRGKPLFELVSSTEAQKCRFPSAAIQPLSNTTQKEKSTVIMKCIVKGFPKPRISWKRNGVQLDVRNKNYKFYLNGLKIQEVLLFDEGSYECIATNEAGNAKSNAVTIKINKPSKVHKSDEVLTGEVQPSSIISNEGDTIQIDCTVNNRPNFPILWFRNNLVIQEIDSKIKLLPNGTILLFDAQLEDSGKYDCVTTEPSTYIFGSAEIIINVAPKILSYPTSFLIGAGATVELRCLAVGYPIPVITWFKDGSSVVPNARIIFKNDENVLKIDSAQESDTGMYTCVAQNSIGTIERSTEVRVKNKGPRMPRIIIKPFDIDVPQFSSIEIPCQTDGEPIPKIQWLKNNEPLRINAIRHKLSNVQSLRLYNVTASDSGTYTCIASNLYGNESASGSVTVIGKLFSANDEQIVNAFHEAKLEVDRAINATINHLFAQGKNTQSPHLLMRIFRYPDEFSRNILKPAEIYARTLVNVRRHITSGLKMNLTDEFIYKEILSQTQLELIANLSGCVPHQIIANCSDTAFHSKYATLDGTCNNLRHPMWGSSYSPFRRILRPIYENGFNTPVGWNKDNRYFGFPKPHPRLVSTSVIRTHNITSDKEITHMVMQWGQFLDHDLDHALPSTTAESWEGLDCKKTCAYSEPCFPMEIPSNDSRITTRRCMDFIRSSAVCGSGDTSVFFNNLQPREQLNQLTSYIDASQVYGFTRDRSFLLRDLTSDLGRLRTGISSEYGKAYLPVAGTNEVDCRRDLGESNVGCFLAGDIRVNEQIGLVAMQTIWLREHNRLATELKKVNPQWNGDVLYYEARRVLIAEMQHITYDHWLPFLIGNSGMRFLGPYTGYNQEVDVTISNVFATAALRIGHTLINPELKRLDSNFKPIPQGHLTLGKAFFSPWRLVEEGGVDPLMRGLYTDPAKLKTPNQNLNDQLIEQLFTAAHAVSLDLAAMNIQRGRDHGLPGYLEYRKFCNLSTSFSFNELHDITDADVRNSLKSLYGHTGNIDVWVGGVLEDPVKGARVGTLFQCLLVEQFKKMRDGDRFWYENTNVFTNKQVAELKKTSLARILCDNGDNISRISKNVFLLPSLQSVDFLPCSEIAGINFSHWQNCGAGCHGL